MAKLTRKRKGKGTCLYISCMSIGVLVSTCPSINGSQNISPGNTNSESNKYTQPTRPAHEQHTTHTTFRSSQHSNQRVLYAAISRTSARASRCRPRRLAYEKASGGAGSYRCGRSCPCSHLVSALSARHGVGSWLVLAFFYDVIDAPRRIRGLLLGPQLRRLAPHLTSRFRR